LNFAQGKFNTLNWGIEQQRKMNPPDNFSHAATIFPVTDIRRSLEFYTEKLEFDKKFEWGEPPTYIVLKEGGVSIHLVKRNDSLMPSKDHTALYIFVHDIAQVYDKCLRAKIKILNQPEVRDYKMKDFDIMDPDGYIITFGRGE
jgi:catechol 2,3-dioxygenase-like lactoylglutathione lyase family enzyme